MQREYSLTGESPNEGKEIVKWLQRMQEIDYFISVIQLNVKIVEIIQTRVTPFAGEGGIPGAS